MVRPIRLGTALAAISITAIGFVAESSLAKTPSATWPPQKYRYTGWMSAGPGYVPHHAFVEGDAIVLNLQDAGDRQPTAYRVCWARVGGTGRRCWNRTARPYGISSIPTGGPTRFGSYVTRWYVGGRAVASWPFLFAPETITTTSHRSR
jgi:hypothetical protein